MNEINVHTSQIAQIAPTLSAGDRVLLSEPSIRLGMPPISVFSRCWMKEKSCLSRWKEAVCIMQALPLLPREWPSVPADPLPAAVWMFLRLVCLTWA